MVVQASQVILDWWFYLLSKCLKYHPCLTRIMYLLHHQLQQPDQVLAMNNFKAQLYDIILCGEGEEVLVWHENEI